MNAKACFTILLLCSVLSSTQVFGAQRGDSDDDSLKQELRQLKSIVTELVQRIEELERRLGELQKQPAPESNTSNTSPQPRVFFLDLTPRPTRIKGAIVFPGQDMRQFIAPKQ